MLTTELLEILRNLITEAGGDDTPGEKGKAGDDDPPGEDDKKKEGEEEEGEEETVPISVLRKVRKEAAASRTALRKVQADLETFKADQQKATDEAEIAKLAEADQHKARAAKAEEKLALAEESARQSTAKTEAMTRFTAVFVAATAAGFHNPNLIPGMLNLSDLEIVDGEVDDEVVAEMVKNLAANEPYLVKGEEEGAGEFGGGPTNPAKGQDPPGVRFTTADSVKSLKQKSREALQRGEISSAVTLYNKAWEKERGLGLKQPAKQGG